jgi:hypothetical protein
MQAIHVTVEVNPRDIPSLVCTDYTSSSAGDRYTAAIAEAVAENLGVQEFLGRPDKIDELRRCLWNKDPGI